MTAQKKNMSRRLIMVLDLNNFDKKAHNLYRIIKK